MTQTLEIPAQCTDANCADSSFSVLYLTPLTASAPYTLNQCDMRVIAPLGSEVAYIPVLSGKAVRSISDKGRQTVL